MIQGKLYGLTNQGKAGNAGAFLALLTYVFIKDCQSSQRVVLKSVRETAMVYQVILIDLQRFAAEMLRKIKFDFTPFLRFVKIIPLKNAGWLWAG